MIENNGQFFTNFETAERKYSIILCTEIILVVLLRVCAGHTE